MVQDAGRVETDMLSRFMDAVSSKTLSKLKDKDLPLPFANIGFTPGRNKMHGMKKQRL